MSDKPRQSAEDEFAEEQASLFRITFGPLVWAVHFLASYAAAAVFCAKLPRPQEAIELLRWGVAAGTVLALGAIAWLGWRSWRQWRAGDSDAPDGADEDRSQFLGHAAFLLAVVSFAGVIFTAMPALFAATCR